MAGDLRKNPQQCVIDIIGLFDPQGESPRSSTRPPSEWPTHHVVSALAPRWVFQPSNQRANAKSMAGYLSTSASEAPENRLNAVHSHQCGHIQFQAHSAPAHAAPHGGAGHRTETSDRPYFQHLICLRSGKKKKQTKANAANIFSCHGAASSRCCPQPSSLHFTFALKSL